MTSEQDELRLSELADGELDGDQIAEVLLGVLDDAPRRERLKVLLRVRQSLAAWRQRRPVQPVVLVERAARGSVRRRVGHWTALAAAAGVGGLLVLAGFWAAGPRMNGSQAGPATRTAAAPVAAPVTPEKMQQVAKVFALHESVAGPLAWYASDDQNIRVASADDLESQSPPIAVLLTLEPVAAGSVARTYVIVCRERQPATIELPGEVIGASGVRVMLDPRATNGQISMQYAIAVDGARRNGSPAILSGRRQVGLTAASLGQLALGDHLLNVEASAWAIRQETN